MIKNHKLKIWQKHLFAAVFVLARAIKSDTEMPIDVLFSEYQFALNYIDSL